MAGKLVLNNWESKGLASPDTEIELNASDERKITFIQMPNGHGKTTTFNLLEFAFDPRSIDEIVNVHFDPEPTPLKSWIKGLQCKTTPANEGEFVVRGTFDSQNFIIKLQFDLELGTVIKSYTIGGQTDLPITGLPSKFRQLLRSGVTDFMMLDGERAKSFLDHNKGTADEAVSTIHRTDILIDLANQLDSYKDDRMDELGNISGRSRELGIAQNKFNEATRLYDERKGQQDSIDAVISSLQQSLADKEQEKDAFGSISDAKTREIEAQTKLMEQNHTSRIAEQTKQLDLMISSVCSISPKFGDELIYLKSQLERNKLPESAGKEWFIELAELDECVCGRPLEATHKTNVRNLASNYLSGNHQNILNNVKNHIREGVKPSDTTDRDSLLQYVSRGIDFYSTFDEARTQKRNLIEEAATNSGNKTQYEAIVLEINELNTKIEEAVGQKEDLSGGSGNPKSVEYAKTKLNESKDKLSEYKDAFELVEKHKILEMLLGMLHRDVKEEICQKVTDETNEVCSGILGSDDMEIESIESSLNLVGSKDKRVGGSVGQTMVLAYSFIQVLNRQSGIDIPLVIDSPCGPLDDEHRKEVAELLWSLESRNIIIFVINTERDDFVDRIIELADDEKREQEIQYFTQFKRNDKTENHFTGTTANAFLSEDKTFFLDFTTTGELEAAGE